MCQINQQFPFCLRQLQLQDLGYAMLGLGLVSVEGLRNYQYGIGGSDVLSQKFHILTKALMNYYEIINE